MSTITTTQLTSPASMADSSISPVSSTEIAPKGNSNTNKNAPRSPKKTIASFCVFVAAKLFFGESNFDFVDIPSADNNK